MVGWHREFHGLEFQQALGVGDPGNLVGQVFIVLDVFRNRFFNLNPSVQFSSVQSFISAVLAAPWVRPPQLSCQGLASRIV